MKQSYSPMLPSAPTVGDSCFLTDETLHFCFTDGIWTQVPSGNYYATTAPMTIYVDSVAGSDVTGDGSIGNPYATITKAYGQVPYRIDHMVEIRIEAGTYTEFPRTLVNMTSREGQFIMEGIGPPIALAGPFTTTGFNFLGPNGEGGVDMSVAGAGWSVDQWYGKFFRFTSGLLDGRIFPIHHNTADMISTFAITTWQHPSVGDTFEIIEPSVKIDLDHGITWAWETVREYTRSSFAMANMAFTNDFTDDLLYTPSYSFVKNGSILIGLVSFYADIAASFREVWYQAAGSVNAWILQDLTRMDDVCLVSDGGWSIWGSAQFLVSATPPITVLCGISVMGFTGSYGGSSFCAGCTRGYFEIYGKITIYDCVVTGYTVDHRGIAYLDRCRSSCGFIPVNGFRADDSAKVHMIDCFVDSTILDALFVEDDATVIALDVDGDTPNIAGYGIKLKKGCKVIIKGGVTLTGISGTIHFDQSGTTVAYPGVKSWVTDGMGSSVIA